MNPATATLEARKRDEIRREAKLLVNWLIDQGLSLKQCEDVVRVAVIEAALHGSDFNISRAAAALDLHRNTVKNEIDRLQIKRLRRREDGLKVMR
jgi:DNA-binding NtrC family response regulator